VYRQPDAAWSSTGAGAKDFHERGQHNDDRDYETECSNVTRSIETAAQIA
jgi:hypothetical protein